MIEITPEAKKKFLEIVEAEQRGGQGLRVIVQGGGTARPEFALNFVAPDSVDPEDFVQDVGEFKIFIDRESQPYLDGASVDYVDALTDSGFKVDAPNAGLPAATGPFAEAVQRVLEEKINPGVASHGGHISLVAAEEGVAYLRFGGGCQGCGMVNVTLKQGVEKILFADVPGLTRVMDVTDHAAGTNPYYQPSK